MTPASLLPHPLQSLYNRKLPRKAADRSQSLSSHILALPPTLHSSVTLRLPLHESFPTPPPPPRRASCLLHTHSHLLLAFAGSGSSRGVQQSLDTAHLLPQAMKFISDLLCSVYQHPLHLKRMLAPIEAQLTLHRSSWTAYQASSSRLPYTAEHYSLHSYSQSLQRSFES